MEAEAVSAAAVATAVIVRSGQALKNAFVERRTYAIYNAKTTILLFKVFEKRRKIRKDVFFVLGTAKRFTLSQFAYRLLE